MENLTYHFKKKGSGTTPNLTNRLRNDINLEINYLLNLTQIKGIYFET